MEFSIENNPLIYVKFAVDVLNMNEIHLKLNKREDETHFI